MLMRIQELVTNLDLKKQVRPIQFSHWTRFLVFARLLKVDAVTGTIERHLALLAATLRTNPAMHSGAEALLLALFANRTTHSVILLEKIMPENDNAPILSDRWASGTLASSWQAAAASKAESPVLEPPMAETSIVSGVQTSELKKNRLKCGFGAVFPQELWCNMRKSQEN